MNSVAILALTSAILYSVTMLAHEILADHPDRWNGVNNRPRTSIREVAGLSLFVIGAFFVWS